jgi:hypothetical protein
MSSQRTHLKKGGVPLVRARERHEMRTTLHSTIGEVPLVRARERHASGQCESAGPDVPGSSVAGGCHAGISRTPHGRGPENRLRLAPGKADHQVLQRNWVRRRLRLPQRGPGLGRPQSEETPTSHTVPTIGGLGMDGIPIARKGKMSSQRTHFKKGGSIRACARRTRGQCRRRRGAAQGSIRACARRARCRPSRGYRRRPGSIRACARRASQWPMWKARSERGGKTTPGEGPEKHGRGHAVQTRSKIDACKCMKPQEACL